MFTGLTQKEDDMCVALFGDLCPLDASRKGTNFQGVMYDPDSNFLIAANIINQLFKGGGYTFHLCVFF